MLDTFYLSRFFFKYYFNKRFFQLPQNVTWADEIRRVISTRTGINGVSLANHTSFARMVAYLFLLFFSKQFLVRNSQSKFKRNRSTNFISVESL